MASAAEAFAASERNIIAVGINQRRARMSMPRVTCLESKDRISTVRFIGFFEAAVGVKNDDWSEIAGGLEGHLGTWENQGTNSPASNLLPALSGV